MAPISGQHASGTAAERRAIERLRTVGHLPQRRAGRIPRAPAEPPGFVAGLRADGRALGHVRLEPERRAEVLAGVDAAPLPAQGRAVREFGARALESAVPVRMLGECLREHRIGFLGRVPMALRTPPRRRSARPAIVALPGGRNARPPRFGRATLTGEEEAAALAELRALAAGRPDLLA
jgi:hypothetical protein